MQVDKEYIIDIRHKIHEYPEIGFELPRTIALVKSELEKMGIPYTEKYGEGSVVGYINQDAKHYTIGLRADMDALLIQEINDIPFKSKIDGQMHACGHDAHMAILLGVAYILNESHDRITGEIKLIFQPAEETTGGAKRIIDAGSLKKVKAIFGLHLDPTINIGEVLYTSQEMYASSNAFNIDIYGDNCHIVCAVFYDIRVVCLNFKKQARAKKTCNCKNKTTQKS